MLKTGSLGLLVAGLVLGGCSRSSMDGADRPNVLLISLDSTRSDLLGAYGRRPKHAPERTPSPNLDRLAREGWLFEDAIASTSWTLPSHHALFTGQPDLVHGVDLDAQRVHPDLLSLAERLSAAGYRTAGFHSGPYLDAAFGFDRGFERYEARYGPELAAAAQAAEAALRRLAEAVGDGVERAEALELDARARRAVEVASHRDRSSREVTEAVLAELEQAAHDARPFFVFAHYFDPHYDYAPPPPFDRDFDPGYAGAVDGADFIRNPALSVPDPDAPSGRRRIVDARGLEHLIALYEGELASTDAEIGRILEHLDGLGLTERTLVVVVADHGDEFFEHGGSGHRRTLYEEVLKVPLILRFPARLPAGERKTGPVSLCDVTPTVLGLVGLDVPDVYGRDLTARSAAGEEHGRGVLSRIVRTTNAVVSVPTDVRDVPTRAHRITLIETYRLGTIKVSRERSWLRASEAMPPLLAAELERMSVAMRAEESLVWIDLALHPDERAEDHETEFSDPAARAALRAFHAEYTALLARRRAPSVGVESRVLLDALRGLGYVGGEAAVGTLPEDELRLPPPGAAVLGD